ncbi:MAG: DNA mismatch repair endonuclease MutL [Candidatus Ornithospirochaeta sp.]|nr:DNA mismatch repair endonuclease MutL [Candidatus Ornithospirochaeta sp.]
MGRIGLLDPLLSARIAAGEVIERPMSILRELLDNSIDAGADRIDVSLEGGGIDYLSVSDNGTGIAREDLELIGNRHATSKIRNSDDLYAISTLGFRGEALYSIAAVTRLSIMTESSETGEGSLLVIDNGRKESIKPCSRNRGTTCIAENLFKDIPARRAFLKRTSTEAQACRNLLVSKALAFPGIHFTLRIDGALRLDWPKAGSLKERVMMLYHQDHIADADVLFLEKSFDDFSIRTVAGNSSVKRSDRKEIRIYVNSRPVDEYSLVQAVTYGYGELLPGGAFPYAAVFIEDSPEYVDFNIHPAKKEVKLRNLPDVHHQLVNLLQSGLERKIPEISIQNDFIDMLSKDNKPERSIPSYPSRNQMSVTSAFSEPVYTYREKDQQWLEKAKELQKREAEARNARQKHVPEQPQEKEKPSFRYIGQAFRLFLIAELDGQLCFIDQHAAHERILYDELLEQRSIQKLLVPIRIELDEIADSFLDKHCHVYTKLGIMLSRTEKGIWEITALPAVCRSIETEIVDFIASARADEKQLETDLFAIIACKAAIKAGDEIDRWSAEALIEKVLKLDEPACPHGRTFIIRLSEKELRLLAGRTK